MAGPVYSAMGEKTACKQEGSQGLQEAWSRLVSFAGPNPKCQQPGWQAADGPKDMPFEPCKTSASCGCLSSVPV